MNFSVTFFSVDPSPCQRDVFRALSQHPQVRLKVFYQEASVADCPWPQEPLAPYEQVLPGGAFDLGSARFQVNWPLPEVRDADVVVCHTLLHSPVTQWLMRVGLRRRPWVFWSEKITHHGGWSERLSAPLHDAAGIAGIGSVASQDFRERFPEPAHFNLPHHCDLTPFLAAPRRDRTDGDLVFLLSADMLRREGPDLLLMAFMQMDERARVLLVGREGELPMFLDQLPARVHPRITYAGFQPPDKLPEIFAQADVFVLPSRSEGWKTAVNQALGAGLPILCSEPVGAGHDLVEEGVNGRRFPSRDADELVKIMNRFFREPALVEQWGAASRQKAAEWSPAVGAEKWVQALQTVLKR